MAEPQIFEDYEFHFTHGDPLYVELLQGRDRLTHGEHVITVVCVTESGDARTAHIFLDKLNGYTVTTRTVEPEPETPEGVIT